MRRFFTRTNTLNIRTLIDTLASASMIVASGVVIWSFASRPGTTTPESSMVVPREPISISGLPKLGLQTAPAVLLMFSDFQCPYCQAFARDVFPVLKERYIDKGALEVAFQHFPLTIHLAARPAAEAAVCADRQGRFWTLHDRLFTLPKLDTEAIRRVVKEEHLDDRAFESCSTSGEASKVVEADLLVGQRWRVTGTPAFMIGRRLPDSTVKINSVVVGARPLEEFTVALDALINQNAPVLR